MKKRVALLLSLCLLFTLLSLSACSGKTEATDKLPTEPNGSETTQADETVSDAINTAELADKGTTLAEQDVPRVTLSADKQTVKPGDTVKVVLNIANTQRLASITVCVGFDAKKILCTDYATQSIEDFYDISNALDNQVMFSGYVLTTVDIDNRDVMEMTFKVNDDIASGEVIELAPDIPEFKVGTDATGDTIFDVASQIKNEPIVITVE